MIGISLVGVHLRSFVGLALCASLRTKKICSCKFENKNNDVLSSYYGVSFCLSEEASASLQCILLILVLIFTFIQLKLFVMVKTSNVLML